MGDKLEPKRNSKRFKPNQFSERLIPILLAILTLVLVATLVVIVLAVLGVTPGV